MWSKYDPGTIHSNCDRCLFFCCCSYFVLGIVVCIGLNCLSSVHVECLELGSDTQSNGPLKTYRCYCFSHIWFPSSIRELRSTDFLLYVLRSVSGIFPHGWPSSLAGVGIFYWSNLLFVCFCVLGFRQVLAHLYSMYGLKFCLLTYFAHWLFIN